MTIEPIGVSQLLDQFARDELAASEKFSPFHGDIPEAVMQRLHNVAAKAYTLGYEDGYGVAKSQAQYARDRDAERSRQAEKREHRDEVIDGAIRDLADNGRNI